MLKQLRLICFLTLFFAIAFSCSSSEDLKVSIDEGSHNYGKVGIGTTCEYEFVITNDRPTEIILDIVRFLGADSDQFELGIDSQTPMVIPAKSSHSIRIRFVPALPAGKKSSIAQFAWIGSHGIFEVKLKGEAALLPVATAAPLNHDYGQLVVGTTDTMDFVVTNRGLSDLVIGNLMMSGDDSSQFTIIAGNAGGTVIPGETFTITVEATPTMAGMMDAILEIPHNADYYANPLDIVLKYESLAQTRILETNTLGFLYTFQTIGPGEVGTEMLEITNNGNTDLTITDIVLAGDAEISLISGGAGTSGTGDVVIEKDGGVHNVELQLTSAVDGTFNATVTLTTDATNVMSSHVINVVGNVVPYGDGTNDYIMTDFTAGMTPLTTASEVSTSNIDDGNVLVQIGFTFYFYGNPWTTVSAGSNGGLIFSSSNNYLTLSNRNLPNTSAPYNLIAGLWDDLYFMHSSGSRWYYKTEGVAPRRVFTLEYNDFTQCCSWGRHNTWQIKLYETTNIIELHYGDVPAWAFSGSATIGINSDDGTRGHQVSGSPYISSKPANNYRFTPIP